MSKVTVDLEALRAVLQALTGEPHYIRELQATIGLPDNPIAKLIDDFNASVAYQTITDGLFGGEE
jgi:hypothetical protein